LLPRNLRPCAEAPTADGAVGAATCEAVTH